MWFLLIKKFLSNFVVFTNCLFDLKAFKPNNFDLQVLSDGLSKKRTVTRCGGWRKTVRNFPRNWQRVQLMIRLQRQANLFLKSSHRQVINRPVASGRVCRSLFFANLEAVSTWNFQVGWPANKLAGVCYHEVDGNLSKMPSIVDVASSLPIKFTWKAITKNWNHRRLKICVLWFKLVCTPKLLKALRLE